MTDAAATLDLSVLGALRASVGDDDVFLAELVRTYLADATEQLAAIEAAAASGDGASLVRPAHTLKSASYTLGAMRLGDLARSLELRGRDGGAQMAGARAEAQKARAEWGAVEAALRSWLDGVA